MSINIANSFLSLPLALIFVLQSASCGGGDRRGTTPAKATPSAPAAPATPTPEAPRATVETPLRQGVWGGRGIGLTVTASGANIEFDCASGRINQKVVPDGSGRFKVEGTYQEADVPAKAGIRAREEDGTISEAASKGRTVIYAGRIERNNMTLTVTFDGATHPLATYNLTQGATPRLRKCL